MHMLKCCTCPIFTENEMSVHKFRQGEHIARAGVAHTTRVFLAVPSELRVKFLVTRIM